MNCFLNITEDDQAGIFAKFCDLSTKDEQDLHLQHLIDVCSVQRRRPRKGEDSRENSSTFQYHVLVGSERRQVCLKSFLALHSVTVKRVKRLRSLKLEGKSPVDKRGKHVKKAHLPETKQLLREHIESFPQKQTQYASKIYNFLDARLNKKLMCTLYNEKNQNNKVTQSYFANFFDDNYNLHFGVPQSDCCCTCEELKVKLKNPHINDAAKRAAAAELAVHNRRAKKLYSRLKTERETDEPHVLAISFDFMQNIQLPQIPVQETFYLRQLTTSVFCIHNIKKNEAVIYLYHEGLAKKGPNGVCSLVYEFLKSVHAQYTELHVYSDNCGGQNKNHALSRMCLALTDTKRFEKIAQFFPVRGHLFLLCDRDFAIIKRALKSHDRIYGIHELTNIIIQSSKTHKFTVQEVESKEMMEFKKWLPKFYKKTCISEETKPRDVPRDRKVNFMISTCMHFIYSSKFTAQIVARPFIDSLTTHTFRLQQPGVTEVKLPDEVAYPLHKVPIKPAKINDIKKLMPYIPHEFLEFYNEILAWPTSENNDDEQNDDLTVT